MAMNMIAAAWLDNVGIWSPQ